MICVLRHNVLRPGFTSQIFLRTRKFFYFAQAPLLRTQKFFCLALEKKQFQSGKNYPIVLLAYEVAECNRTNNKTNTGKFK